MNNKNWKWLLGVVALCWLAPAAFATTSPGPCAVGATCAAPVAMPEGGSTAIYLLGPASHVSGPCSCDRSWQSAPNRKFSRQEWACFASRSQRRPTFLVLALVLL